MIFSLTTFTGIGISLTMLENEVPLASSSALEEVIVVEPMEVDADVRSKRLSLSVFVYLMSTEEFGSDIEKTC